jgi:hypothetical protein
VFPFAAVAFAISVVCVPGVMDLSLGLRRYGGIGMLLPARCLSGGWVGRAASPAPPLTTASDLIAQALKLIATRY